ncbi:STAS/SEC14 domain-containing protein [Tumidithrix helvetica PCC 7403]|uniref:STAS/SEC14 domain-containing protein n=1 Tax=Tumidithrix helvetica TaxID=3457545 RepID=UPI003C8EBA1E
MTQIKIEAQLPFEQLIQTVEQLNSTELEQLLAQIIRVKSQRKAPNLPKEQSLLLQQINQSIPLQLQERYHTLISKRRAEIITDEEYQELLDLSDRVEALEVKRLERISELAKLRQTSLTAVIQEFQLQPKGS